MVTEKWAVLPGVLLPNDAEGCSVEAAFQETPCVGPMPDWVLMLTSLSDEPLGWREVLVSRPEGAELDDSSVLLESGLGVAEGSGNVFGVDVWSESCCWEVR